jgi:hypothetical protein
MDKQRLIAWLWTDASGVARGISAVLLVIIGGVEFWSFTWMVLPDEIWEQLMERGDHQIAYQEFVAVVLAIGSFNLKKTAIHIFVDNNGVLYGFMKGRVKKNDEVNTGIGKTWLEFASRDIAPQFYRVESKSNLADGPSRMDFELMHKLNAKFVQPVLLQWAYEVWSLPSAQALDDGWKAVNGLIESETPAACTVALNGVWYGLS